jgi:hypothetical protein
MKQVDAWLVGWRGYARLGIMLGAITVTGCDSGETVLKMPEGGPAKQPTAEEIEKTGPPPNSKMRKGIVSRRERQKELEQQGAK